MLRKGSVAVRIARLLCCAMLPSVAVGQDSKPPISVYLWSQIGLSTDEWRSVDRGVVVTHVLPVSMSRDISILGVFAIGVPRGTVDAYLGNIPGALTAAGRRAFGIVHDTAAIEDFSGLTLSVRDAATLRKCRVGSCAFKLASADMARLRALLAGGSDDSVKASRFE